LQQQLMVTSSRTTSSRTKTSTLGR
jgi:hypothetical protein